MASNDFIKKIRKDKDARVQARIQKLRELNLKNTYGQNETNRDNASRSASENAAFPKNIPNFINNLKPTISNVLPKKSTEYPSGIPKKTQTQIKNIVNDLKKPEAKDIQKNMYGAVKKMDIKNNHKHVNWNIKKVETKDLDKKKTVSLLYKPKTFYTEHNIKHDKKPIAPPIVIRRNTTFDQSQRAKLPVRRSISAVHFEKIDKGQLRSCIHRWASIGEKINKVSLHNINENENIQEMVSAVKSEQKKIKFQTPLTNPDEMRLKLVKWLEKRGKTIDTYQHLHCFGIQQSFDYGDENKENQPLENDSDNESFTALNGQLIHKWPTLSNLDSVELDESYETAVISDESPMVNDALLGALNDLTDILRNGYSWEEGARWLRAIRDTYTDAQETATYWECRAALEEARGDMPASMQCWEQALAKGANRIVAEENIDQLLAKFMQLKINPGSEKKVDPKLVDAKNVFKSTLLRFPVQENK
ncbi:unnamed protein product [Pieris brassicae]|uniref:Uncharacterized protein n=1 Tax=Pieris brassicae TaxID=7116 RepID=A0A9P0TTL7_PIEBR|nr:unnamed protein product [Pieris brassicae]